jgi:hypothetical protein
MNIVASGDVAERFAPVSAADRLAPPVRGEIEGSAQALTARSRSLPVFAGAGSELPLELRQVAKDGVHSRPCAVMSGPCVTEGTETGFFISITVASVFNRSRVERASRSNRVTITTSPGARLSSKRRSCARSALAPLTTSRNTLLRAATRGWRTRASMLWPSVDTHAYP